jgi:hypothetical protein
MPRTTAFLASFLLIASCSQVMDTGSASPQDRQSILEAIRGGMTAEHTAFVPVPPVCPGPVPTPVREQLLAQAPGRLGAYFTSPQLEREIAIANGVVSNPKGGPACIYGAGVDWVRLDFVSTSRETAVATGQFRAWSRIAQWHASGPKTAEPHNTLDATFNLRRINGRWLISSYDWNFAPGSEP